MMRQALCVIAAMLALGLAPGAMALQFHFDPNRAAALVECDVHRS